MRIRTLPETIRRVLTPVPILLAIGFTPAAAQSRAGGTAVVAIPNELEQLDPLVASERWTQEVNRFVLYLPLVRYTPALGYEGRLASSWTMTGDTGVVFRLRPGIRWQDGVPVTSADVVFTFERAKDPRTAYPNSENFQAWTSARAEGPLAVRFRWTRHGDPLAGLPFLPIVPKHALDTVPPERMRQTAFNEHPIGDGPFRFVEHRMNDRWVFEASPNFPAVLGGPPRLARLILRIVPEPSAQAIALQTGEADLATAAGIDTWLAFANKPAFRRVARPTRTVLFIIWNELRPIFRDVRVRRALAFAIDRPTILQVVRKGNGQLAVGPIAPGHWAFDRSLVPLPYAPDSSRRLLRQAGYLDRNGDGVLEDAAGHPLAFDLLIMAGSSSQRAMGEMLQAQFARVGARVNLVPTDAKVYFTDVTSPERRFDAAGFGMDTDFRIVFRENFHSATMAQPGHFGSYANPEVDRILDQAIITMDRAKAMALWSRFQRILQRDQPWTFLFYVPELTEMSTRLDGVTMDMRGLLVDVTQWRKRP